MRQLGDRQCPGCGKFYWANQAWLHEKCGTKLVINDMVTRNPICNHCVTKDAEIERLRNQIEQLQIKRKLPKRNRAKYMQDYRKRA